MNDRMHTLAQAVEAAASPGDNRFVFHLGDEPLTRSAAQLMDGARARAGVLLTRGLLPGEPVGVLGPNSPEWVEWAFAVWFAGGVLVPIPYPLRIRNRELFAFQVAAMTTAVDCRTVVTHERFLPALPVGLGMPWGIRPAGSGPHERPASPDDPAVIQFTSGATTQPKGALLSHRAVLASMEMHRAHHRYRDGDVGISWLPFFHDNGLFGHVLLAFLNRGESHYLPTEAFARSPARWFRIASEAKATLTSGPSSAWAIALAAALRHPDGVDLSQLRLGVLSAETIDPDTVDRLVQQGPALGLKPETLVGGYGLAEATLGVTTGLPGEGIPVDAVDLHELAATGRAIPATGGRVKRVASCGRPLPGVEVRIVDDRGADQPERMVGEILVRSPSLMTRYVGREAPHPIEDGWLHTGDLGYLDRGVLLVTGRMKEVIISVGRNYNPEDIERAAGRLPEVRAGRVVAFAPPGEPDGALVVAFEPTNVDQRDLRGIRQAIADATGLTPRGVIAVARGSILRTTSGKLRRAAVREAWERGELAAKILASEPASAATVDTATGVREHEGRP